MDKAPKNEKHTTIDGVTSSPSIDNTDSQLTSAMNMQLKDSYDKDIKFAQSGTPHKDSTESTPKK